MFAIYKSIIKFFYSLPLREMMLLLKWQLLYSALKMFRTLIPNISLRITLNKITQISSIFSVRKLTPSFLPPSFFPSSLSPSLPPSFLPRVCTGIEPRGFTLSYIPKAFQKFSGANLLKSNLDFSCLSLPAPSHLAQYFFMNYLYTVLMTILYEFCL